MTTTVPLIYSFTELLGVADAVADHVITAQNMALYNTTDLDEIRLIREERALESLLASSSSVLLIASSNKPSATGLTHHLTSQSHSLNISPVHTGGKMKKDKRKRSEARFKLAISGGSLINILHQGLLPRQDMIEWDKWDIFFADERLVPFDSPDSNYGQAKRELFDHITGDKQPCVFHINEALIDDPQECADNYEQALICKFAKKDSVKLPLFDLFMLGCAPDGHIASLFPNHGEQLREKLAWCMPVANAPLGPANRITLSIPVISHAARVTFVVEGSTKAPIIRTIMERPEKGLPSSIVNESAAGKVTWFVDDDALKDCYEITLKKYKYLSITDPAPA